MKKNLFIIFTVLLLSIILLMTSCQHNPKDTRPKEVEWNYLIYMNADNDLEQNGIDNIKALQKNGSGENANIIVLFDRIKGQSVAEGSWTGTKLFKITKNPASFNDDVVDFYECREQNLADPDTLYKFLCYVDENYPAKHTLLNIWGHAEGVYNDGIIPTRKTVFSDWTEDAENHKSSKMTIYDFSQAIKKCVEKKNKKIDIIQFDCCMMQMLEVCYQLKDLVDYIVGASSSIASSGSDYQNISEYLSSTQTIQAEDFAKFLVTSFDNYYQSKSYLHFGYCALKTSSFDDCNFVEVFNAFCEQMIQKTETDRDALVNMRANLSKVTKNLTEHTEYADFNETAVKTEALGIDTSALKTVIGELIVKSAHSSGFSDNILGLSLNFPATEEEAGPYFREDPQLTYLDFYNDTRWDEFLCAYFAL